MAISALDKTITMPMLALRGLVVFPGMLLHFDVGREKSINALNRAMASDQTIFLLAQKDVRVDDPGADDLYEIGCVAKIRQILRLPDNNARVLIEGLYRAEFHGLTDEDDCFITDVYKLNDKAGSSRPVYKEALIRKVQSLFEQYAAMVPKMPQDIALSVISAEDPSYLADYIASNIQIPLDDKQYVLEELNPIKRLKVVIDILDRECQILGIDAKINEKTKHQIDDNQRDYYLREQLKVISGELYGEDSPEEEADEYYNKISRLKANETVKKTLRDEVTKLFKMPNGSHEATVVRNYLDMCLSLPWGVYNKINTNIDKAQKLLDKEHYGLKKVKERILEVLSVYALNSDITGQIICLSGPPGVGKTSIAKSLASCMGRKFARVSLGGVHDESEIRGHRRTYIGAMPGKIIKSIKQAGSSNPLILLDEVDKLGADYKGDPSSALLEVLDSEQNMTFLDHYIDMPFDLSKVVFVTTANNIENIPSPLLDRMDVIELPGYTREDKFNIAVNHLLKKQLKKHGLTTSNCKIDKSVIYDLIDYYTREAGVRKLERSIAALCRKVAMKIVSGEAKSVTVRSEDLITLLGQHRFKPDSMLANDEVGVVNGLAWTSVGGELMQLEVAVMEGSGKLELTGSLGDVMQESAKAAVTWVRANSDKMGIENTFYKTKDIHIHATEAAVPKDGPSAGVTMVTAVVSALSGIPIRRDVAMTGEVSIRGRVLPIGGLTEKTMAAYRAGINTVIVPKENESDLAEIDKRVAEKLEFVLAERVEDVLKVALTKQPKPFDIGLCTAPKSHRCDTISQ